MDFYRSAFCDPKSPMRDALRAMRSGFESPQYFGCRRRFLVVAASVLMAVVFSAGAARASTEVFTYGTTSNTTLTYQGGEVVGVNYATLGSPITFNSLGFIDIKANPSNNFNDWFGPDGLVGSYEVGIWLTSTQTLLASTTVDSGSTLIGNFRYSPISATTIPANTGFTIAVLLPNGPIPDAWLTNSVTINSPSFSGGGIGRTLSSATLSFPTVADSVTYSIVNASTAVSTPEPTSTACIFLGLGCFAMFRHRRPTAATT